MAYQWPLDKVGVVNSALRLTGDNIVAAADDGSDEGNVASAAYERGMGYIAESHSWGYAKLVVTLNPSPTAPPDTQWDTAYPIPSDCAHIVWLKINQDTTDAPNTQTNMPVLYDIENVGGVPCIVVNSQGGPPPPEYPQTPAAITLCYISNSGALSDSTMGTPTLILALQSFIQAGIYTGLHEDGAQGAQLWAFGEKMLQMARTRYDQQKPKRQFFNSRMAASRRIRRPWPPIGLGGWGNSGGGPG